MSKRRSASKKDGSKNGRHELKAVTAMVTAMWAAAEKADPPLAGWLHKKIYGDMERLNRQVDGKLRLASLTAKPSEQQPTLFPEDELDNELAEEPAAPPA